MRGLPGHSRGVNVHPHFFDRAGAMAIEGMPNKPAAGIVGKKAN